MSIGYWVASPGDVDGDGYEEVAAYSLQGGVLFSTTQANPVWAPLPGTSLYSPPFGGGSFAAAGDVNGDELPDMILGNRLAGTGGRVRVVSGAPLGVSTFGVGCAGSSGGVPRIGASKIPVTGNTFPIHLSKSVANSSALCFLGFSNASWWGTPLPLPLGFLGLPGCALEISPDFVAAVATTSAPSGGRATVTITLPFIPGLVGNSFYAQWYVVDPGPSPLPGAMTRGLSATIQG
jgi:hypothetical protein